MKLYLVQHGEAQPEEVDPKRPLTEKGKTDVSRMAKFLKEAEVKVDTIWHSSKTRAIQTAQIFGEALLPKEGIMEKPGLAPNDPVDQWPKEVTGKEQKLMIVGHLPFLQKLTSMLLTGAPETRPLVDFHPGGVVCLERKESGEWRLIWAITPDLIAQFHSP